MAQITFKINGRLHTVDGKHGPEVSLNEYIRKVADLRGTKYMCLEGGCGACVVSVTAPVPPSNEVKTFAVNSCLVSVLSCHGWEVTTVEGIGNRTKGYHVVQQRLASFNGTQCGFCTPGWVSNMYSLYQSKKGELTSVDIENSFAGNICRCTGYRSIADAFKTFANDADEQLLKKVADLEDLDMFKLCGVKCKKDCSACKDGYKVVNGIVNSKDVDHGLLDKNLIVVDCGDHTWYKAYSLEHVFNAMQSGDYRLVAGNTGQGVFPIDDYPRNVIDILSVVDLKGYQIDVNLTLGAGMPLNEMMEVFQRLAKENEEFFYLEEFYEHMDLVAHVPVRNIGTIAGNLCMKNAHKDFQSDLFLLFETVGGLVTIAENKTSRRSVSLPEFLDLDLKGKIVLNVILPPLSRSHAIKTYKIMPRSQNAHAVVNAGFLFQINPNTNIVDKATIVYGSLSPEFIHASKTEAALIGKDLFTNETLQLALKSLDAELVAEEAPPEPAAAYRKQLAIALFYKAILKLCPDEKVDPTYHSGGDVIKRSTSKGIQTYDTDESIYPINQPVPKIEALIQCAGESVFADDLPTQVDEVFAAFVTADVNPGSIVDGFDASAALNLDGVVAFYTAKDIPGKNSFTPRNMAFVTHNELVLGEKEVLFNGQPFGIIVADKSSTAVKAAKLVKVNYASINRHKPLLTIEDVLKSDEKDKRVIKSHTIEPTEKGENVKEVIKGEFKMEAQYHYTMETQTCVVKPTEDGMEVYSATQWLDYVNTAIAQFLNVPLNSINVIARRLGGGYGGKSTRSAQIACATALVSHLQGRVCRMVLPLRDNMKIIGKRLPTSCKFDIGVNSEGEIQYLNNSFYQDVGNNFNEGGMIVGTATRFCNGYDFKRWHVEAHGVATDTPSNTWCRAPTSTEGVAMVEYIMEKIAYQLKKDPIAVKRANLNKNNPVIDMMQQLKEDADYDKRSAEIKQFNEMNRWRKRAINILPMTYSLSPFGNFNAIVSIYHSDGSVVLTHGGIEMGQGINTKAAQVCAYKLGVPLNKISVKPSTSFTSPNAIVTGGSVGSDCVAYAVLKACEILENRLKPIKNKLGAVATWEEIVESAFSAGINLQAIYTISNQDELKPYTIYGVAALEVEVDVLTGNHDVIRVDLLEDTGRSMNPEVDIGQVEGAFVMGLGYWTLEKIKYDTSNGKLLTDRTWNYKPPGIKDIPADMRISFKKNASNELGVLQSKATGEPALNLATTVIHALREAVRAARVEGGYPDEWFDIDVPCTVENIFMAVGHKLENFKLK